jgi:predicted nucleic acid-binding protein
MVIHFADTSFWVALVDRRDAYHAKALEWSLKISGSILTTEAMLIETANTFSKPNWRDKVIALINHIMARADIEVVPSSSPTWGRGWKLFGDRLDKSWSLTDCISFDVMQERGLTEALAADSHFRQAGFSALLLDA